MIYGIILDLGDGAEWYYDSILPGFIPDHMFDLMESRFVHDNLDICEHCPSDGRICHVQITSEEIVHEDGTIEGGRILCPYLFHDVVKPKWKLEDVV